MAPKFLTDIQDAEVFVAEGEPAMFECRVEPKHDLNLSVRWYRNDEELVSGGRMRISHEYGHVSLQIFYTHPEDEGRYVCRATNELGEDQTEANLICRPLPHLQFQLPPFEDPDESVQMSLLKEATARHGIRAKLRGDEIYQEGLKQAPRFLLNMEHYPKLLAGQGVTLETFVVPVGDQDMKLEWFLNKEPLLFKSSFTPVYDYGFIGLSISKVYPDDFGLMTVRVSNKHGSAELEVHFIGNPKPEIIWTKDGEELVNSRHVQIRERENKTILQLINVNPTMAGEYRLVVISSLGSDLTFCNLSVLPLHREERQKLSIVQKTGLDTLIRYEEEKLIEKKRKKQEKEDKLKIIKDRNKKKTN